MILNQEFFEQNAVEVARELIGYFLCRKTKSRTEKYMIVETEAYEGSRDKASHAHRGKTLRNSIMFGKPGVWYIYFTYGMHYMLNIVCGSKGHPAAVLIRGLKSEDKNVNLIGPARLTRKLGIDKNFNGKKASPKNGLWIEPPSLKASADAKAMVDKAASRGKIKRTPRIGVAYAGPIWSKKPYRFVLKEFESHQKQKIKK